ncbi:MAG: SCP2 sterol-binding domain-containing protein [Microthrixaceae bacterium]|nr:SCP2 sterol-binding domain-containing protein [Microthrixaceae bacterium]
MQYLSDEWIEAADAALAAAWASRASDSDSGDRDALAGERGPDGDTEADGQHHRTTIGYTITAAPGGKTTYHLFVGDDGAGLVAGKPADDADTTMELDYGTAVQIAKGETSPQVAFMQGRLKLGGDVTLLIKGVERLSAIGDALTSITDVEY